MKTKFVKALFSREGEYLFYGPERKFVARFKHKPRGGMTMAKMEKMLINRYTTEEYFTRIAGDEAPLKVFMNDGFYGIDLNNRQNPFWYNFG